MMIIPTIAQAESASGYIGAEVVSIDNVAVYSAETKETCIGNDCQASEEIIGGIEYLCFERVGERYVECERIEK
jgi:hypothetical protein